MTYDPVVGAIGHAVASALGVDPKSTFDDDLVRLKSLLEDGKATARGRTTSRAEVAPRSARFEPAAASVR